MGARNTLLSCNPRRSLVFTGVKEKKKKAGIINSRMSKQGKNPSSSL